MKTRYTRLFVQLAFALTCLVIALEFIPFAAALEEGRLPDGERPPGVEAFLPISALVSLKYLAVTGRVNEVHPSALVILGLAVAAALAVKKSLCAWICPIGLLSELLFSLRKKVSTRFMRIQGIPDLGLRMLKYLILGFFLYTILFQMNGPALEGFVYSAYHIVADIKMLRFFTQISPAAAASLLGLVLLSFAIPYFWCRYLCPYGALMGLAGFLSPVRVRRNEETCTGCRQCDRACPCAITVSRTTAVRSDECISCGRCTDACPEPRTLGMVPAGTKRHLSGIMVAALLILVFLGGSLAARKAGIWQNQVPDRVYLRAMLETGLLDINGVKDMDGLIQHLDRRGKQLVMMQLMQRKSSD